MIVSNIFWSSYIICCFFNYPRSFSNFWGEYFIDLLQLLNVFGLISIILKQMNSQHGPYARFGYLTLISDPKSKQWNMAKIYEKYVQNIPKDVARWLGYDATGPRFQKFRKFCKQKFSNAFEESTNRNWSNLATCALVDSWSTSSDPNKVVKC